MAYVLKDLTVLPAHPHVHPQWEWAIPAFAFPTIAGTQFTDPGGMEGWVGLGGWLHTVVRQFTYQKAVTHPTTNRAQCRATALIETDALPLH